LIHYNLLRNCTRALVNSARNLDGTVSHDRVAELANCIFTGSGEFCLKVDAGTAKAWSEINATRCIFRDFDKVYVLGSEYDMISLRNCLYDAEFEDEGCEGCEDNTVDESAAHGAAAEVCVSLFGTLSCEVVAFCPSARATRASEVSDFAEAATDFVPTKSSSELLGDDRRGGIPAAAWAGIGVALLALVVGLALILWYFLWRSPVVLDEEEARDEVKPADAIQSGTSNAPVVEGVDRDTPWWSGEIAEDENNTCPGAPTATDDSAGTIGPEGSLIAPGPGASTKSTDDSTAVCSAMPDGTDKTMHLENIVVVPVTGGDAVDESGAPEIHGE
jgi:hypothetical protein